MEVKISDLLPDADISGLPAPVQADPNRVREAVMGKLKEEHMQTTKRTRKIRRTLVLAVAAAALLGVTALAAAMGGFDWLRETVDPPMLDAVEEQGQSVTSTWPTSISTASRYPAPLTRGRPHRSSSPRDISRTSPEERAPTSPPSA